VSGGVTGWLGSWLGGWVGCLRRPATACYILPLPADPISPGERPWLSTLNYIYIIPRIYRTRTAAAVAAAGDDETGTGTGMMMMMMMMMAVIQFGFDQYKMCIRDSAILVIIIKVFQLDLRKDLKHLRIRPDPSQDPQLF